MNLKRAIVVFVFIALFVWAMTAIGIENESSEYAGSSACQPCHMDAYNAWKSSKHASIFQPATDTSPVCSVCHATGMNASEQGPNENDVGCEACHGPGRNHITNEGDTDRIVLSQSADICGRCHNGNQSGESNTWTTGYRPGMRLSEIAELKLIPIDPEELPPPVGDIHPSFILTP